MGGDFFRTVRFGGFNKEDVMRYVERLEGRVQDRMQESRQLRTRLEEETRLREEEQTRAAAQLDVLQNKLETLQELRGELEAFRRELTGARELVAELEHENIQLRKRMALLEQPRSGDLPEQEGLPLEQLTFRLFLEDLEDGDASDLAFLNI
ncbi:MAG: hypothetical protein LBJ11_10770 [Oscillospiraceae bacterium]|nr:hypothetical protein [Oscillospiraceae bacterium]